MSLPVYSTGTVAVAAGGTVVTLAGGVWTGTNAKQGDFISIGGSAGILITEVTDATHLKIPPWSGAAQTVAAYLIYQNYVGRVVGVAAAEDVGVMLEKLHVDGLPFIVGPSETVPDPSYGDENQFAFKPTTGEWWQKIGGVWVPSPGFTASFIQSGAGAVTRSMQDKARDIMSVKDFGAKGDGVTNDTAACNAAHATGKLIYYPKGNYVVGPIALPAGGGIRGDGVGPDGTRLFCTDNGATAAIRCTAADSVANPTFENFSIEPNSGYKDGPAIVLQPSAGFVQFAKLDHVRVYNIETSVLLINSSHFHLVNCELLNYKTAGLWLQNPLNPDAGDSVVIGCVFNSPFPAAGILHYSSGGLKVSANKFNGGAYGYRMTYTGAGPSVDLSLVGNSIENMTSAAIALERASGTSTFGAVTITGNQVALCPFCIVTDSSGFLQAVNITGNLLAQSGTTCILLDKVTRFTISGNTLIGINSGDTGIRTTATCSYGKVSGNLVTNYATPTNLGGSNIEGEASGGGSTVLRGYLSGLGMSTPGAANTITFAVGVACDSTNTNMMAMTTATSRNHGPWTLASGGMLDTGALGTANTWYHFYCIKRPDTGVVDVCMSLSATAPTFGANIPAAYSLFRRIGSGKFNASSQWVKFIQDGDQFVWDIPVNDINATNPGTAAVTRTISTPPGVRVKALLSIGGIGQASDGGIAAVYISDLSLSDQPASQTGAVSFFIYQGYGVNNGFMGVSHVMTNTAAQIRSRVQLSSANNGIIIATNGWVDRRGRDD